MVGLGVEVVVVVDLVVWEVVWTGAAVGAWMGLVWLRSLTGSSLVPWNTRPHDTSRPAENTQSTFCKRATTTGVHSMKHQGPRHQLAGREQPKKVHFVREQQPHVYTAWKSYPVKSLPEKSSSLHLRTPATPFSLHLGPGHLLLKFLFSGMWWSEPKSHFPGFLACPLHPLTWQKVQTTAPLNVAKSTDRCTPEHGKKYRPLHPWTWQKVHTPNPATGALNHQLKHELVQMTKSELWDKRFTGFHACPEQTQESRNGRFTCMSTQPVMAGLHVWVPSL